MKKNIELNILKISLLIKATGLQFLILFLRTIIFILNLVDRVTRSNDLDISYKDFNYNYKSKLYKKLN